MFDIGRKFRLRRAVKEAFDNLPIGICFFDRNGMVTLCNTQMNKLVYEISGNDIRYIDDIFNLLGEERSSGGTVIMVDGKAWRFRPDIVIDEYEDCYTQITATDVDELYAYRLKLEETSRKLERAGERMRKLTENIRTVIREEEILGMKIRVHDDIGRSVIATRSLLNNNRPTNELDLTVWKNAVRLLMRDNEKNSGTYSYDISEQLKETSSVLGIEINITGDIPDLFYNKIFITAVRECASNAVRHAGASTVNVKCSKSGGRQWIALSNDGRVPDSTVTEGGGLSSLRDRIEKSGGTMNINSYPFFELVISFPLKKEVTL